MGFSSMQCPTLAASSRRGESTPGAHYTEVGTLLSIEKRVQILPCGNYPIEERILARKTSGQQQEKMIDARLVENE
jgi:hypothetical protein